MFNLGFGEIIVVLLVALVVVGPDDLPKVARWMGRNLRKLREMLQDIKRQSGLDEVEQEVKNVQRDFRLTVQEMDVTADVKDAVGNVKDEFASVSREMEADIHKTNADIKL